MCIRDSIIAVIGVILLLKSKFNLNPQFEGEQEDFPINWKSLLKPHFLLFYAIIFLIVFAEQIFNSWLPTFYKRNLNTDSFFALQSSAFLALFSFGGRLIASKVTEKITPLKYFYFCLSMSIILLFISHFLGYNSKDNVSILSLIHI